MQLMDVLCGDAYVLATMLRVGSVSVCVGSVIWSQPGRVEGWVVGLPLPNCSSPQSLALLSPVNPCQGFGRVDTELT